MTTMEISRQMSKESGVLSTRSMVESVVLHAIVLALLMFLAATVLVRSGVPRTKKEIDIVFYHPAVVPVASTVPPPPSRATGAEAKPGEPRKLQKGLGNRNSQQVRKRAFPRM